MRRLLVIAFAGIAAFGIAAAQERTVSRYAVEPSADGFVRLDTETGAVSHCTRREGVWYCDTVVEDRGALERRIDALTAKVDALTKRVEALAAAREGEKPGAPHATVKPAPPEDDLDFAETLMRRFFEMVREMKQAQAGRT
jgi:hypothetical protein